MQLVTNWERNHAQPKSRKMPEIISFLGYDPTPQAETPTKRPVLARTALGLSQKVYAEHNGVPRWKLAMRERGLPQRDGQLGNRTAGAGQAAAPTI